MKQKTILIITLLLILISVTTVQAISTKQMSEEYQTPTLPVGVHDQINQECRLYNQYTDYQQINWGK